MAAVLVLASLAAFSGLGLLLTAQRLRATPGDAFVDQVDALLPQSQCGQCGYPGCRPYAAAIANGEAPINRCAPGGEATIRQLADLLQRPSLPLDPRFGQETAPQVAVIDEALCIGCARCLEACPVDAILGAPRFMHTVIADECTGCGLCLPPCPADCIRLVPAAPGA